ncbi:NADH:ubiquinone reductase (Na(+)-transporting) subunit D [Paracoccus sp. S-4012]|uniref:NADH:ubiquinone reductase (Na(+)-transporting) subunit D n=1 Tax=Paracoccus sp. S-4012 TaxID=2665648 RepID=UPI0012B06734|nr:NADH:ubiquinone reductase (Na(+)-transporting) subunit D [Paracoccus sp. S-4012]MRX49482.1 NADH:ubiquinone reductase (Na(+)-transporting) subunit D [Paracoccus sp. S-4012]
MADVTPALRPRPQRLWRIVSEPLIRQNPVTVQILGICSALAVTTQLATALTMAAALTAVVVMAAGIISLIRHHIPNSIRLIVQIVIIAALVGVIDQLLRAFLPDISRRLSVFVSLITTNCIVMGHTESFARRNPPLPAMADALGSGLGYSLVLVTIGALRELFGSGTLMGQPVLPTVEQGGWFEPLSLMLLAPSAFFMLGLLVWAVRSWRPEQAEPLDFAPPLRAEEVLR